MNDKERKLATERTLELIYLSLDDVQQYNMLHITSVYDIIVDVLNQNSLIRAEIAGSINVVSKYADIVEKWTEEKRSEMEKDCVYI